MTKNSYLELSCPSGNLGKDISSYGSMKTLSGFHMCTGGTSNPNKAHMQHRWRTCGRQESKLIQQMAQKSFHSRIYRHSSGWSPFWEPISDTCCAKHRSDYSLIDSGCKPSNPYVLTENYIVQCFKKNLIGSFSMTNLSTFIYWWVRSLWCRKTASKFTQIGIAPLKLALSWSCRSSLTTTYIHT